MSHAADSSAWRKQRLRAVFLGPPGSGKGTQAAVVSDRMGLVRIATGDMLRAAVKQGTDLGKKADEYMKAGQLVPDELVMAMLFERLRQHDCLPGFVLDGFPRNEAQAIALDREGFGPDLVLHFKIGDEVIVKRTAGRLVCESCGANFHREFRPPKKAGVCDACGGKLGTRKDDAAESVRQRLKIYHGETRSLIDFYKRQGLLREVEADRQVEKVSDELIDTLASARPSSE